MLFVFGFLTCAVLVVVLLIVIVFWGPIVALIKAIAIGLGCFFGALGNAITVPPPTRVIIVHQRPAASAPQIPILTPTPVSIPTPCADEQPGETYSIEIPLS